MVGGTEKVTHPLGPDGKLPSSDLLGQYLERCTLGWLGCGLCVPEEVV